MEKKLNFNLMLSLEEMALRRVLVSLWNETDILSSIGDSKFDSLLEYQRSAECRIIVNKVKQKVSKLVLPKSLKKGMMDIVKLIGLELLEWKTFHENIFNCSRDGLCVDFLKQLCWTSAGSVDYQTTAEKLLRLEVLVVQERYKLAALYCFVDYIPALWEQLPDSCKEYYSSEGIPWAKNVEIDFYWAYILAKGESKLDDDCAEFSRQPRFHAHAFMMSAVNGNKAATKYFFKRLTSEERENFLPFVVLSVVIETMTDRRPGDFPRAKLQDVLSYLLSLMSSEEQMVILKRVPCCVLTSFLDWQWQDIFLDIADRIWTFLPERRFERLLWGVQEGIENSDYYLPNLFQNFFLRSPSEFKNHFMHNNEMLLRCFCDLFRAEDTETIKVIFRSAGTEDRMRMVSSESFFELLDFHLMTDRWHMIKVCLDEATESIEDKDRLKETYIEFLNDGETSDVLLRRRRWGEIFEAIDKISKDNTLTSVAEEENKVIVKN